MAIIDYNAAQAHTPPSPQAYNARRSPPQASPRSASRASWWRRWLGVGRHRPAAAYEGQTGQQPAPQAAQSLPTSRDAAYFDGVAALACSGCFHIGEGSGAGTPFDHTPT